MTEKRIDATYPQTEEFSLTRLFDLYAATLVPWDQSRGWKAKRPHNLAVAELEEYMGRHAAAIIARLETEEAVSKLYIQHIDEDVADDLDKDLANAPKL